MCECRDSILMVLNFTVRNYCQSIPFKNDYHKQKKKSFTKNYKYLVMYQWIDNYQAHI